MPHSFAPLTFVTLSAQHLRAPDLLIIAAYLVAITLFGLHFRNHGAGQDKSLKTYFLAGNTAPWWAIALSVVSAETSTLTIISIPGVAFAGDFGFLQVVIGYLLGRVVVAALFLPRYFAGEMLTAYQLIDRRFGPFLHKVTAGLFLITRAAAEGVRVFAVSIVVTIAIGTGDVLSIGLISLLTLLYTFEGGLAAVIWTDVIQMGIYVIGTLVALLSLGHHVQGGWSAIAHTASAAGKFQTFNFAVNLTQSYTFWAGLLGGTFLTMASHGTDQLMVQRLLAARNLRESRLALLSSGVVILAQFAFFLLIGAGLWVFYGARFGVHAAASFRTNDYIFPTFITQEMPTGIAGLLVAAILAAAMSNLSAALNSLSSTTVVDFYIRARPEASDRERTLVSKASTALWAIVLFAVALVSLRAGGQGHVVEIGLSIASVAYGCLLGVFLLGTLTRFANERGTALGMLTGFALNVWLWKGTFPAHVGPVVLPHIAFTWFVLIGALVTFAVGALASLVLKSPSRSAILTSLLLPALLAGGLLAQQAKAQEPSPTDSSQNVNPAKRRTDPKTPNAKQLPVAPLRVAPQPTADFSRVLDVVNAAIAHHQLPGAVVVVGHGSEIVFHQAFGDRKIAGEPGPDGQSSAAEPMTEDTLFDMASLTKCIVTTTAIMQLYESGKLDVNAPVERYLPDFNPDHDPQRTKVTVRLLLTHFSGEAPDISLKDPWGLAAPDKAEGIHRALTTPLAGTPGAKMVYSDINFILLGTIVERLSGEPLQVYAVKHIFQPLGMQASRYHAFSGVCGTHRAVGSAIYTDPAAPQQVDQACAVGGWTITEVAQTAPTAHDDEGTAATNPDFDHLLRGTVHDPTTRRMGGVAGHAGLFSDAHDMSVFSQAMLDRFAGRPSKFPLKRGTLMVMAMPQQPGHTPMQLGEHFRADRAAIAQGQKPATGDPALIAPNYPAIKDQPLRAFGWDVDSGYSKPRGRVFPIGSFGHTGFTGTSLWLDPQSDTFVLLLSNAVHPKVGPAISNLRGEVASAAAMALSLYGSANDATPPPSTGQQSEVKSPATDAAPPSEQSSKPWRQTPVLRNASFAPPPGSPIPERSVKTGLEVLESTHFAALGRLVPTGQPLRLGLLTNQTGLDSQGRRTIDVLYTDLPKAVPHAHLMTLFSPEHGIFGRQDTEHLAAETDPATGLHVTSLYGAHAADRHPTHEQLKDLDAVVIDLQDAGVRCFTYETVLGYFLEAAAAERAQYHHELRIVVLDRPNPLSGVAVSGPVSDPGTESYINYMPIPLQHGLTLGELARYMVRVKHLDMELQVVALQGWKRTFLFGGTGLPWTPPSPNLHTETASLLYPATCMLELTNLSVGRGTPLAFEVFGAAKPQDAAPWFQANAVADALNARQIPGVRFVAIQLSVPEDANRYPGHGQTIPAVHIVRTDEAAEAQLDAPALGVEILSVLHKLYPTQFQMEKAMRIVASRSTLDAVAHGDNPRGIIAGWKPALDAFRQQRPASLLY